MALLEDNSNIKISNVGVTNDGNTTLTRYIKSMKISSKNTALEYQIRLNFFKDFVLKTYNISLDELIKTLTLQSHGPKIDVYDMLSDYVTYIQTEKKRKVSPMTIKLLMSTVRSYLETFDVEISPRKFRFKVRMPRVVRAEKEALLKSDIQTILNSCPHIKLKTYVLFLAATGCRAREALSIRLCDINFENDPPTAFLRGEYTKTRTDRILYFTDELAQQLKSWLEYKYRTRNISHYDRDNRKSTNIRQTPKINNETLIFSTKQDKDPAIDTLYTNLLLMFEQTLDRLGGKFAEFEGSKTRRKITFHSMRRWVKSTITDQGYKEFSDSYIGHAGSTYYRKSNKEKIDLFKKIEPYLTLLDQSGLERKGVDLQNRLETMEHENKDLRENINKIMEMIQQNPELANAKPEALTRRKKG